MQHIINTSTMPDGLHIFNPVSQIAIYYLVYLYYLVYWVLWYCWTVHRAAPVVLLLIWTIVGVLNKTDDYLPKIVGFQ